MSTQWFIIYLTLIALCILVAVISYSRPKRFKESLALFLAGIGALLLLACLGDILASPYNRLDINAILLSAFLIACAAISLRIERLANAFAIILMLVYGALLVFPPLLTRALGQRYEPVLIGIASIALGVLALGKKHPLNRLFAYFMILFMMLFVFLGVISISV